MSYAKLDRQCEFTAPLTGCRNKMSDLDQSSSYLQLPLIQTERITELEIFLEFLKEHAIILQEKHGTLHFKTQKLKKHSSS